jgi:hypothetical protein
LLKQPERRIKIHSETFIADEIVLNNDKTMKTFLIFNLVAAGVLLAGCATVESGLTLDTVGPVSAQPAASGSTNGTLVVYSAYKINADFNSPDPYRREYSDYRIFTTGGKLLLRVRNNSGTVLQNPASVELPSGEYRVLARVNGYGHVTIPVIIAAGQNTVLHLNSADSWPDESAINPSNAVRMPDGQIVGPKAAPK